MNAFKAGFVGVFGAIAAIAVLTPAGLMILAAIEINRPDPTVQRVDKELGELTRMLDKQRESQIYKFPGDR